MFKNVIASIRDERISNRCCLMLPNFQTTRLKRYPAFDQPAGRRRNGRIERGRNADAIDED